MRKLSLLIVSLTIFLLAGCQATATRYVMNTAGAASGLAQLELAIDPAVATVRTNWDRYTPTEQQRLESLFADLSLMRDTVRQMVKNAGGIDEFLIAASDARLLYLTTRASYQEAREIIIPHLTDIAGADRVNLQQLDALAIRLDKHLAELLRAPDGTDISQVVGDALTVAAMVARIAAI